MQKSFVILCLIGMVLLSGCVQQERPKLIIEDDISDVPSTQVESASLEFYTAFNANDMWIPKPPKSEYTVSFIVVNPTNKHDYVFSESKMRDVVDIMDEFWKEMSHEKTRIKYDTYHGEVEYPGDITCLRMSGCYGTHLDDQVFRELTSSLNITSDMLVILVNSKILEGNHPAMAARNVEDEYVESLPTPEGNPGSIRNIQNHSIIFIAPNLLFSRSDPNIAKVISHEFLHTRKFIETEDTYIGSAAGIYNLIWADLMGNGLTSYLSVNKRAAMGWEEYQDIDALNKWATIELKPNCMEAKAYRIPLGRVMAPEELNYFENFARGPYYHNLYIEWVGNDACSYDLTNPEGIQVIEVFEGYNEMSNRLHADAQFGVIFDPMTQEKYNLWSAPEPSDAEKNIFAIHEDFSIEIVEKNSETMTIKLKVNREKEELPHTTEGKIYTYQDQAVVIDFESKGYWVLRGKSNKDQTWMYLHILSPPHSPKEGGEWLFDKNQHHRIFLYYNLTEDVPSSLGGPSSLCSSEIRCDFIRVLGDEFDCNNKSLDMTVELFNSLGESYEFEYSDIIPC